MGKFLTAIAITKLKPTHSRQEFADGGAPGLRLIVQPSGGKSWAMRFRRPNGKTAKLTLGPFDASGKEVSAAPLIGEPLTVAAARALAAEVTRQRARGLDVVADARREKRNRRDVSAARAVNTFEAAVKRFMDEYRVRRTGKKPRRWLETGRLLGLDHSQRRGSPVIIRDGLCDRLRDKPIVSVTSDDVFELISEARRHGIPGLQKRNQGISNARGRKMADALGGLFGWLHEHRYVRVNPCVGARRPPMPPSRDRVLNVKADIRGADELRWFWAACEKVDYPFGVLCKLLLLTGCRLNELARATREELSDDYATLRLSGSRTKNNRPHNVAMSTTSIDILRQMPNIVGCKFLFSTNGRTPISGFSKYKSRLDVIIKEIALVENGSDRSIEAWRLHDLRRTAATGMAGIGIAPHIVEAALNHVSGAKGGVAGTYNRETYDAEKRQAMERWSVQLTNLIGGHRRV